MAEGVMVPARPRLGCWAVSDTPWYGDGPPPEYDPRTWSEHLAPQRERYARRAAYANRWGAQACEDRLSMAEMSVSSQNGEDGVVAEIMAQVGAVSRTFVEFGVQDGREGSCVALADVRGWTGWFLEADPDHYRRLAGKYRWDTRVHTAQALVTAENINKLFRDLGIPPSIDVASIDIDGAEHEVWHALDASRPRLVIVEYNSALDPDIALVPREPRRSWDGTQNVGSSLGTMLAIADKKDYDLVHCEAAGVNAFFIAREVGWNGPVNDQVPRRTPNYFLSGLQHPGFDASLSGYVEVER
jgi:hypothetical protein